MYMNTNTIDNQTKNGFGTCTTCTCVCVKACVSTCDVCGENSRIMSRSVTKITHADLAQNYVLRAGAGADGPVQNGTDFVVVDVRGDDRPFGWIPGSLSVPAHRFLDDSGAQPVARLLRAQVLRARAGAPDPTAPLDVNDPVVLDECSDPFAGVKLVVFHCALSQVRGPKSAMRALTRGWAQDGQIAVLEGGFVQWQSALGDDPRCVVNLDKQFWLSEYF